MKIPNNLVAGDRLWYSETEYATVGLGHHMYDTVYDKGVWLWATGMDGNGLAYDVARGAEVDGGTKPIIRIERIASAPAKVKRAKVDSDAPLKAARKLAIVARQIVQLAPLGSARYKLLDQLRRDFVRADRRAIARRLEGSKP